MECPEGKTCTRRGAVSCEGTCGAGIRSECDTGFAKCDSGACAVTMGDLVGASVVRGTYENPAREDCVMYLRYEPVPPCASWSVLPKLTKRFQVQCRVPQALRADGEHAAVPAMRSPQHDGHAVRERRVITQRRGELPVGVRWIEAGHKQDMAGR